jgi:hypothetical protein
VRAALEQDGGHTVGAELVERRAHAGLLVLARGDDDVGAGHLERVGGLARRGARDDDGEREVGRPCTSALSTASRPVESNTTRRGWRTTPSIRAVSWGSSASAVPMPTATASHSARQRCARARLKSPEIHFESPVRVATLPSSVIADLKSTHGRPVRECLRKAWLSSRARAASSPSATSICTPSSRRIPRPRPLAFSVGSSEPTTTRAMPAASTASVHGGCLPWWQQGSSVT